MAAKLCPECWLILVFSCARQWLASLISVHLLGYDDVAQFKPGCESSPRKLSRRQRDSHYGFSVHRLASHQISTPAAGPITNAAPQHNRVDAACLSACR